MTDKTSWTEPRCLRGLRLSMGIQSMVGGGVFSVLQDFLSPFPNRWTLKGDESLTADAETRCPGALRKRMSGVPHAVRLWPCLCTAAGAYQQPEAILIVAIIALDPRGAGGARVAGNRSPMGKGVLRSG
jgi:hypothetical protein